MKYIKITLAAALIALVGISGAMAKSSGSSSRSSSSSSSSRSSSSFDSSSKSYSAPKPAPAPSKPTTAAPSKPNTAVAQTSQRPTSAVDAAKYKAASQNGTTFKTRESAVADFKAKKASTYTSKYTSEPPTRPSHIPTRYSDGGRSYDVSYNPSYGGYGYMNALGAFIIYDALTDPIMTNRLMAQNNYYVGNPPVATVQKSSGWSTLIISVMVIGGVIVLVVIGYIVFKG